MSVPTEITSCPTLLFLYYRIEQLLGIKAAGESLVKLNNYLENHSGSTFLENPAAFENILDCRKTIYKISKLLTVNETYFFREGVHFEILLSLLPQFEKLNRPIQICSAASSIGCEAYSIAMLLDYHSKNTARFNYDIDAFDICDDAIETAKNGHYTTNTLRKDGSNWKFIMDQYINPNNEGFTVSQDIRDKVHFFTHNIMHDLKKQYDVIFFRNAFIYFSPQNRSIVINNLAQSIYNNGFLFLGISETSSVEHPQIISRFLHDVFYFQKVNSRIDNTAQKVKPDLPQAATAFVKYIPVKQDNQQPKTLNCKEVKEILEKDEGKANADKTINIFLGEKKETSSLCDNELVSSIIFFLNNQDFDSADLLLSFMEKHFSGAFISFLRGEYYLLQNNDKEAIFYYERAARKEKTFWPAFYRTASFAINEKKAGYEYTVKKAYESLELGKDLHYECFMGGFSPDYFYRILERKS